jgi:hypothetical protein
MKTTKKWAFAVPLILGCSYMAMNPQPVYALFGIGDVVFDPTSWAALGDIWQSDLSNGIKLAETYNQTVKIVENGLQMYNIANAMAQRITNKDVWKMAAFAVGNEITETHYNETVNFNAVMNGDWLHAGRAWHDSTLYGGGGGYLGGLKPQDSTRMSSFATMQLLDQTSQRCAEILGQYKSTQDANQAAEDALASDTYDMTDAKNSLVAALNVLSGGRIHMQTQLKASGNLQACLAEQQNWFSDIAAARASETVLLDPTATAAFVGGNYLEP